MNPGRLEAIMGITLLTMISLFISFYFGGEQDAACKGVTPQLIVE